MRRVLALAATLLLPAVAHAGYPYDDDDDDDYVSPPAAQWEPGPAAPATYPVDVSGYSVGYVGPHPVPYDVGSDYCYVEGAHAHEYPPFDQHLFRESQGYYYFVGDPVDFGYARTVYWYNGNHVVPLAYGGGYCFISWPHRHHYQPGGWDGFRFVGGYWLYDGPFDADYWRWRSYYWGYYGGYYRSWYYGNRYHVVRPPPAYRVTAPVRIAAAPGTSFGTTTPPPAGIRPGGSDRVPPPPAAGYGARADGHSTYPAPAARAPSYGAPSYRTPAAPAYGAPGYRAPAGPSYGAPAYRAPAYSAPSYSAPSYSAPAHSNGGGGFRSAPSYSPSYTRPSAPAPAYHAPAGGHFHR